MIRFQEQIRAGTSRVSRVLDRADAAFRAGLGWQPNKWTYLGLWGLAVLCFFFVARGCRYDVCYTYPEGDIPGMLTAIAALYAGAYGLTLAGLYWFLRKRQAGLSLALLISVVWGGLLVVRIALLDFVSGDYDEFLSYWYYLLQGKDLATAMAWQMGDYNLPYMYVMFLLSRIQNIPDLYLIKLASILFDYVLAFFVMKLVALQYESTALSLSALLVTLLCPTVLLNGSYWGQCDVIYASLGIGGLYFAITDHPNASMAFFALSLSFKLQAIFLLPMMLVLYGMHKIKLKHVLTFLGVFFLVLVPPLLAGRSLADTLSVYPNQMGQEPRIALSIANIFGLELGMTDRISHNVGMALALTASLAIGTLLFSRGKKLSRATLICGAFLMVLTMPLLLPHMQGRYYFLADALSLCFLFYFPRKWYLSLSVLFCSFVVYVKYFRDIEMLPLMWPSILMVLVTVLVAMELARQVARDGREMVLGT